jgi:putative methylase
LARIPPRIELELMLDSLKPHPDPDPWLEQYTTPAEVAAEMLFTAAFIHDDVEFKLVADLGCGTGRLGIGALVLGAHKLVGVDIDPKAIAVAIDNSLEAGVFEKSCWITGNVSTLQGSFDTILMNPPFGTRRKHLDVAFLNEAFGLAEVVYSVHKSSTRQFIMDFIGRMGYRVSTLLKVDLEIPHIFEFHERIKRPVEVDIYRIVR